MSVLTRIKNNQITDATIAGGKLVNNTITAGKLEDDMTYGSNLTITGNLTVNGATTTVSTTNTTVEDAIMVLNSDATGAFGNDAGIYMERGDNASVFMGYDGSASQFALVETSSAGTEATVTITDYASLRLGGLTADDNITATGTVQGATVTDGTASLASGSLTSAVNGTFSGTVTGGTLTDGTASLASGSLTSAVNGTFSGTVTGGTLTDGTASITSGAVTGVTTLATSGEATLASATVSDLTAGRVTYAGTSGALTDEAGFEYNATTNTLSAVNVTSSGTVDAGTLDGDNLTINALGTIEFNENVLGNIGTPVAAEDAATKGYVDGLLSSGFTISDGTTTQTISQGDTMTLSGTANEVEVAVSATDTVTIGLPSDVTIGNNLTVTGDLTVNGTTTTVNSTVTQVVDPIMQLGRGADNAALSADDAKDRGVSMYYYVAGAPGSEKVAFMGFDTTNNNFTFVPDATITSEVVSGAAGAATFGAVTGTSFTDGTATLSSGALSGVTTLGTTGEATLASATVSDLTDGRVVLAGTSGALEDSTNLTFNGSTLAVTGAITASTNITATSTVQGATVTDGAFSVTSGAVTGVTTLATSGEATLASATVSDLTDNRVVIAGTSGALEDDANFTYNGTQLTVGGADVSKVDITNAGAVTATGTVTGGTLTDGTASITGGDGSGFTSLVVDNVTINGNDITATTALTINEAGGDVDFRVESANNANMLVIDAATDTVNIATATPTTDVAFKVGTTTSAMLPVGDNSQRPVTGVVGMLRFNTTTDSLEQYASTGWEAVGALTFTVIASETFDGDNSTVAFTLADSQTTASCIVSINGVVQLPTTAYAVSGTTLTFTEAPLAGDKIEVRKITTTQTVTNLESTGGESSVTAQTSGEVDIKGNLMPSADSTYSIGNAAVRWTDIYVDAGTIHLGAIQLKESGGALAVFASDGTTAASISNDSVDATTIVNGTTNVATANGGDVTFTIANTAILSVDSTGIINEQADGTGNIGNATVGFNTVFAKATSAQYADLAEKYEADADYEPGTVVHFGGDKEVTECDQDHCSKVAGVVSTAPAYRMNDGLEAEHTAMVALVGRVPCKVQGPVAKGDMMVSAGNGKARAEADPKVGAVIGKALEDFNGEEGVIEVVVGKH